MIDETQTMPVHGHYGMKSMPPSTEETASRPEPGPRSGKAGREEFQARLNDRFGADASGLVSESGEVDMSAVVDRLQQDRADRVNARTAKLTENITRMFGEEAAATLIGEDGRLDRAALAGFMEENGYDRPNITGLLHRSPNASGASFEPAPAVGEASGAEAPVEAGAAETAGTADPVETEAAGVADATVADSTAEAAETAMLASLVEAGEPTIDTSGSEDPLIDIIA